MTAMKRGPAARSCSQRSAPSRTTSFRSSPQDSRRRSRTSWSASCRQRFGCCRISRSPHDPELLTEAPTLDEVDGKQVNVYTVNPDAVWSDGTPITAADFAFTAKVQDAEFVEACPDGGVVGSIGYDQIESINGSDDGKTVTVTYGTPRYADWQALFTLLPAHLLDSETTRNSARQLRPDGRPGRDFRMISLVARGGSRRRTSTFQASSSR